MKIDYSSQTFHVDNSRLNKITVISTSSIFLKCFKNIYNWRSRQIHVVNLKNETKDLSMREY